MGRSGSHSTEQLFCVEDTYPLGAWRRRRLSESFFARSASETSTTRTTRSRHIIAGIEKGKQMPIRDIIDEEKSVQREMLLNDGDMSFISSDDEDFRWIDDFSQGKIEIGLDTGDPKLDEYFRYKKEFVIVNGHSNVGKTTTMLYLIANSAVTTRMEVGYLLV